MAPRLAITLLLVLFSLSQIYADDAKYLYLRWPGGHCSTQVCCFPSTFKKKNIFLVQYLGSSSSVCNFTPFEYAQIKSLRRDLYKFWPSLDCPSNSGIRDWESIWDNYGVCSGFTELEYFKKTLILKKKANLLLKLIRNDIRPSNNISYALSDVVDAINDEFGVKTAVLDCGSTGLSTVRSVRLCVDETATNFIDCPVQSSSTCSSTVTLKLLPKGLAEEDAALSDQLIEMVSSE